MALTSTSISSDLRISSASNSLFSSFTFMNCFWNVLLLANLANPCSLSKSRGQSSPIFLSISLDSAGLHAFNQRRGVIPLVTLVSLPGYSSSNSGNRDDLTRRECISATPLTANEPITDRWPIRTIFSLPSSMIESLAFMALSPGHFLSTSAIKRWLIS